MKKILSILFLLLYPVLAEGAIHWVNPSGTMTFPTCNAFSSAPIGNSGYHASYTDGVKCLNSGDTLMMRTGTYSENIGANGGLNLPPSGVGSANNYTSPTIVQAYNNEVVTVKAFGLTCGFSGTNRSYIIFKDLHSGSVALSMFGGMFIGSCGGTGQTIHHIKFDGVDFQNAEGRPTQPDGGNLVVLSPYPDVHDIWITGPAPTVTTNGLVFKSKMHRTSCGTDLGGHPLGNPGYPLYNESSGVIVENTEIYDTGGYGIQQLFGTGGPQNIYQNNWFHDIGSMAALSQPCSPIQVAAIFIGGTPDTIFRYNLVTDSMNGIDTPTNRSLIYNNTFARIGNGRVSCILPGGINACDATIKVNVSTGTIVKNNLLWNSTNNTIDTSVASGTVLSNNYFGNDVNNSATLFKNPTTNDYTLQSGSQAINFGTASICTSGNLACPITITGAQGAPDAGFWEFTVQQNPSVMVFRYHADENTGTTLTDSSGNGFTGTLSGGVTWTTGSKYGASTLNFDGISGVVTVPDTNLFDFTTSFTFSAWVFPTRSFSDFAAIIIHGQIPFLYATTGAGFCGLSSTIGGFGSVGTDNAACDPNPLPVNTWTYLTVTYDGTTIKLYKNAVLVASTAVALTLTPDTNPLTIGASIFGEYFKGRIDEIVGTNTALPVGTPATDGCSQALVSLVGATISGFMNCDVSLPPPAVVTNLKMSAGSVILSCKALAPCVKIQGP